MEDSLQNEQGEFFMRRNLMKPFKSYNYIAGLGMMDTILADFTNIFDTFNKSRSANFYNTQLINPTHPRIDITNSDKVALIVVAVPGLSKEEVKVNYKNGTLTLSGQSKKSSKAKVDEETVRQEIYKSAFSRDFVVEENEFDIEKISAKVENGLLVVCIPKCAEIENEECVREIEIQ